MRIMQRRVEDMAGAWRCVSVEAVTDMMEMAEADPEGMRRRLRVASRAITAAQRVATAKDVQAISEYIKQRSEPLVAAVVKHIPNLAPLARLTRLCDGWKA